MSGSDKQKQSPKLPPPSPKKKRSRRRDIWRINGKASAFILEKRSEVKGVEIWTPEAWYNDPVHLARSVFKMKAASIVNLGEGNLVEAVKKAHAEIVYLLKEAAPLEPFAIEWAEKMKGGGDE
jgi:hypothetical protein